MTRTARRRLFYALLALFLVLGTGVVLYAQGWRFDFATRRFNKVGAIYLRTFPADASISLNGNVVDSQVGFLSRGTLITDLFPKTYQLKLTRTGYDGWHENASISPALVTELKYAVLVPSNATSAASSTVKNVIKIINAAASTTAASYPITLQKGNLIVNSSTLASNVKNFSITANGSMVAALESKSVEIFSLNNSNNYYRFNLPNMSDIVRLIWYRDQQHLFVVYKNSVAFLDFADSGLSNFTTVAQGTSPLYEPQTNLFYITNANRKVMVYAFPQ